MVTGWLVELSGTKIDLQELPNRFSSSEANFVVEDDRYYLKSDRFNSFADARDVLEEGKNLVKMINGLAKLEISNWLEVKVVGIARNEEEGRRHQFIFPECITVRSRVSGNLTVIKQDGSVLDSPKLSRSEQLLSLTFQDEKLAKVLRLYGSAETSWVNLNRIFEVIQSDVGGLIVSRAWARQSEIDTFTQTASSSQAIGDEARHGHDKIPAPKKPMTLKTARALIDRIATAWLDYKLSLPSEISARSTNG